MKKSKANKPLPDLKSTGSLQEVVESIDLKSIDSLIEAAHKVLSYYFAVMLSHEAGTRLGVDPEELHDMRVCTRRLRAVFDVFGAGFSEKSLRKQRKGLRTVGRALGLVRDWDVFLLKAQQDISSLSVNDQTSLQPVVNEWIAQSQLVRQNMVKYLDSSDFQTFKTNFGRFSQEPNGGAKKAARVYFEGHLLPEARLLRDLVPGLLYTRLANIRAYDSVLPSSPAEVGTTQIAHLHALRIEVKRMHYSLDFFKEILGPESKALLKAVKNLQDHLGDLHDADVACLSLERISPSPALQNYISLKKQQRQTLLEGIPAVWQAFNSPENRSLLARSILVL